MTEDSFRLTPLDIRTLQFRRRMRGYDQAAVEEFRGVGEAAQAGGFRAGSFERRLPEHAGLENLGEGSALLGWEHAVLDI